MVFALAAVIVIVMGAGMLGAAQSDALDWVHPEAVPQTQMVPPALPTWTPETPMEIETRMPEPSAAISPVDSAPTDGGIPAPPGDVLVLAHYLTWFKTPAFSGQWQHWNWDPDNDGGQDEHDHIPDRLRADGLPDLAGAHRPLIGPYDSRDPDVVEYQLSTAWAAGVDGFVADWYGPHDEKGIDEALDLVFETVERWRQMYGFRFFLAIAYEEQILSQIDGEQAREEAIASHLRHALDHYAVQDSFLRYQGVPLIFFFEMWTDGTPGLLQPDQLARVQSGLPAFHLLYMGAEQDFLDVAAGFYSWVGGTNDDPADWGADYVDWVYGEMDNRTREHDLQINVGSVWAGFDDSMVWGWGNTPRSVDRQDGAVYAETWASALLDRHNRDRESPSWVQIVTWNDWNEGSEIEPSVEYGRNYLEATQHYATLFTGRYMPPSALLIPEAVFRARKAQPGPGTEAMVEQAHRFFFTGQFERASTVLRTAGFLE